MRIARKDVAVRVIEPSETEVLALWAEKLRPIWGEHALEEIIEAELRICACLPDCELPIGFASITPYGSPDGRDEGQMWLDHLFVEPEHRRIGVQEILYDKGQIPYIRNAPRRRVLRVPLSPSVVSFSTKRGWRKERDLPFTPYTFGVYELPHNHL